MEDQNQSKTRSIWLVYLLTERVGGSRTAEKSLRSMRCGLATQKRPKK